jgi:hypothetical protein
MKVKTLIRLLAAMPQDMDVVMQGPPHEGWVEPANAKIVNDLGEPCVLITNTDFEPPA